ncbi:MAG: hypothetical protein QXF16_04435 [Metallosphaera sp.]
MSFEIQQTIFYFIPLSISYLALLIFGWLNRNSFSQLDEKFSLSVKLYYVMIVGIIISILSEVVTYLKVDIELFSVSQIVGTLLILSYLFDYSLEVIRLGDDFNSRGLKIASLIIALSIPVYLIIGAIPFALLITSGGMYEYIELTKIITLYKRK